MGSKNSDLLPPLFDQILAHHGYGEIGAHIREDIVRALETGIVNAAAARERETNSRTSSANPSGPDRPVVLRTSDRLSGEDLSRTSLVGLLEQQTGLKQEVLEIALLLVEAQIDLRLKGAQKFTIAGLEFSTGEYKVVQADTQWCTSVLAVAAQAAARDERSLWFVWDKSRAGIRVLVDTIQLSAAQRDALPYEISIDSSRVEPLLADPRTGEAIRVLHVSDLHLAGELRQEGRKLLKPLGAPTHSFTAARLVANAVRELSPSYDLLIATGDLTTDGSRESFETVMQYVQSGTISGSNPMRIAAYGLGASKSKRVLIPGNHDRYAGKLIVEQHLDNLFEQTLGTPRTYPYAVGFRPHNTIADREALTLLLFVFDSTLPEGRDGGDSRLEAAAVGEIGPEELSRFEELAKTAAKEGRVDQPSGEPLDFSPTNCVRVALLHHHPLVTYAETTYRESGFFGKTIEAIKKYKDEREAGLVQMKDGDEFLRSCMNAGVQLALFGHQHYPYRRTAVLNKGSEVETPFGRRLAVVRNFCCPTTLQYDAKGNGFYVFDFKDRSSLDWSLIGAMRSDGRLVGAMKDIEGGSVELDGGLSEAERLSSYSID